ncbi:PREDICTED: uncharacterized protein LOC106811771 [Priapulus caudatus]|uniref:Uncharacterized protein LOC106811771 n=1 Tax=Priapulus caudatus TaxID=37621 RepID=A0ABM1EFK3_PRICU|nr:PREDICTED: uncharacterized protein LOC106811771 [Priapulus caudatus]
MNEYWYFTNEEIRLRATGVLFLLGVGSVICYKLYKQYKRKLSGTKGQSKKRRRHLSDCEAQEEGGDEEKLQDVHVVKKPKINEQARCRHAVKDKVYIHERCSDDDSSSTLSYLEADDVSVCSGLSWCDSEFDMGNQPGHPDTQAYYSKQNGISLSPQHNSEYLRFSASQRSQESVEVLGRGSRGGDRVPATRGGGGGSSQASSDADDARSESSCALPASPFSLPCSPEFYDDFSCSCSKECSPARELSSAELHRLLDCGVFPADLQRKLLGSRDGGGGGGGARPASPGSITSEFMDELIEDDFVTAPSSTSYDRLDGQVQSLKHEVLDLDVDMVELKLKRSLRDHGDAAALRGRAAPPGETSLERYLKSALLIAERYQGALQQEMSTREGRAGGRHANPSGGYVNQQSGVTALPSGRAGTPEEILRDVLGGHADLPTQTVQRRRSGSLGRGSPVFQQVMLNARQGSPSRQLISSPTHQRSGGQASALVHSTSDGSLRASAMRSPSRSSPMLRRRRSSGTRAGSTSRMVSSEGSETGSVASSRCRFFLDEETQSIQLEWDEDYDGLTDLPEDNFDDLLSRFLMKEDSTGSDTVESYQKQVMIVNSLLSSESKCHVVPNMVKMDSFDMDPMYNADYFQTLHDLKTVDANSRAVAEECSYDMSCDDEDEDPPAMVMEDSTGYYQTVRNLSDIDSETESEKCDGTGSECSDGVGDGTRDATFRINGSDSDCENGDYTVQADSRLLCGGCGGGGRDASMASSLTEGSTDPMMDSAISITYSDDSRTSTLLRRSHARRTSMTDSAVSVASREADVPPLPQRRPWRHHSMTASVTSDSLTSDSTASLETVTARSAGDGVDKRWSTGSMFGEYAGLVTDRLPEQNTPRSADADDDASLLICEVKHRCLPTDDSSTDLVHNINVTGKMSLADYMATVCTMEELAIMDPNTHEGYTMMSTQLGFSHVQPIRKDGFAPICACLFQMVATDVPLLSRFSRLDKTFKEVEDFNWLAKWKFDSQLALVDNNVSTTLKHCLYSLQRLSKVRTNSSGIQEAGLIEFFNSNQQMVLESFEAVKLLMLVDAVRLQAAWQVGHDVPTFYWCLFGRETSCDPEHFMMNHLNGLGKAKCLQPVELSLLAYTLCIRLRVIRPQMDRTEEYAAIYPDFGDDQQPMINLLKENESSFLTLLP